MNLDPEGYRRSMAYGQLFGDSKGGQELILHEIVSLLLAPPMVASLWLPFSLGPLADVARWHGIAVEEGEYPRSFEALYFGTPTIVSGKKLFPESALGDWNVSRERNTVRGLCNLADRAGARLIISGLGSGDINAAQRISDMKLEGWSDPKTIAWKDFGDFEDRVIAMRRTSLLPPQS